MSKHDRSKVERTCEQCGQVFWTQKRGKGTAHFCSQSCRSTNVNRRPAIKQALSRRFSKPLVTKTCEWCGQEFQVKPAEAKRRRFCGLVCSNTWKSNRPGAIEYMRRGQQIGVAKLRGRKRPEYSARMTLNNPMLNPKTVEKMRQKMIGRPFKFRGGNGKLTPQQVALAERLKLTQYTEYPVRTKPVRDRFESIPTSYKVDIADPRKRLAIEVDGKAHQVSRHRWLDERKTLVLNALGWSVLRFTNQEIDTDLERVAHQVELFITSK